MDWTLDLRSLPRLGLELEPWVETETSSEYQAGELHIEIEYLTPSNLMDPGCTRISLAHPKLAPKGMVLNLKLASLVERETAKRIALSWCKGLFVDAAQKKLRPECGFGTCVEMAMQGVAFCRHHRCLSQDCPNPKHEAYHQCRACRGLLEEPEEGLVG